MRIPSFSERALLNQERLTEFEEAFVRFVLRDPEKASRQTITGLAQRFYVSPNSIVRLARKLGYGGFSDMRVSLSHEVMSGEGPAGPAVRGAPDTGGLVRRTLELCCDPRAQARAIRLMRAASRVSLYAVGETAYVAQAYAQLLENFDSKTQFVTYENQLRREIERGPRSQLLFLVSLSGETAQVVGAARQAREAGVPIVSMTDLHRNTLASLATVPLFCCSPQRHVGATNVTDLTPLAAALTSLQWAYVSALGLLADGDGGGKDADEGPAGDKGDGSGDAGA